jgi:hypothetical protein
MEECADLVSQIFLRIPALYISDTFDGRQEIQPIY